MNDDQINAAIATECGWEVDKRGFGWLGPNGCYPENPNYCEDLNAMHEAEKVLDYEQCEAYSNAVADIVQAANHDQDYPFPWHCARIHAPARQRAEAFLKALGKWEEAVIKDSLMTEITALGQTFLIKHTTK